MIQKYLAKIETERKQVFLLLLLNWECLGFTKTLTAGWKIFFFFFLKFIVRIEFLLQIADSLNRKAEMRSRLVQHVRYEEHFQTQMVGG